MSVGNIPQLFQGQRIVGEDGIAESWFVDAWNDLLGRTGGMTENFVGNIINGTQDLAEAYATDDSATGRLVWTVDVATNVATIEQTAATGYDDGTWNGSAISLTADEISLRADALNLGSDTTFEATHDTFYTVAGSYRFRYGGPFGTSSDLLQWYGLNSVALNSETKTNGVFALATDGKVYFGSTAAGALSGISLSNYYVLAFTDAVSAFSGVVTATALDGDGTYTYFWTQTNQTGAQRVTCSNINIAGPTFSVEVGGDSGDAWTCTITETSTGRSYQATVKFNITRI